MAKEDEGLIKRKPDAQRVQGKNETKGHDIDGTIDFSVTNVGTETIWFGFLKDQRPDIPVNPGESSTWPLYRSCEVWDGELFIRFGNTGSVALITKTI